METVKKKKRKPRFRPPGAVLATALDGNASSEVPVRVSGLGFRVWGGSGLGFTVWGDRSTVGLESFGCACNIR